MASRLNISQINHICDIFGFDTEEASIGYAASDRIRNTVQIYYKLCTLIIDEYYIMKFGNVIDPTPCCRFVVSFRSPEIFDSRSFDSFDDICNFITATDA